MNYWDDIPDIERSLTDNINMNIYNSFISRTNWTTVALVVVTVTQAIVPFMSPQVQTVVTAILGAFIVIFHVQGVNRAAINSSITGVASSGQ